MKRLCKLACSSILLFVATQALAELPFITDDPDVTDFRHSEFYLFGTKIREESGTQIIVPAIQYNYGIIPDVEIEIVTGILTNEPRNGLSNSTGFTDIQAGFKWEFLKESKYLPAAAINFSYFFPTGNVRRGLGNGRPLYFIPIWLQKTFDKWTVYGGGGRLVNSQKFQRNFWFGGMVVQRAIDDHWTLGAEVYAQGDETFRDKSFTLINLGGYYFFRKDFALLFSAGPTVRGANNTFMLVGFEWSW